MSFIVSIVIAMFFFFGGCLQLGAYIARNSVQDVPAYVHDLMLSSWPLAVAAVLFMLIELRLHGRQVGETGHEEGSIIERPIPQHAARPAGNAASIRAGQAGARASTPQAAPPAKAPRPVPQQVSPPFVTPPPFEQSKEKPHSDKQVEATPQPAPKEDGGEDLSFFKL